MKFVLPLVFAVICSISASAQSWQTSQNLLSSGTFGGDIDIAGLGAVWAIGWQGDFETHPWQQMPSNQFSRKSNASNNWITGNYPASPEGAYTSNIHSRGVSHAFIATNDVSWGPKVYETTNGGAAWTALNVGLTKQVRFVHFFSQNHGIAVGEQDANHEFEIFTTQDGGLTWGRSSTSGISNAYSNEKLVNDLYTADGIEIWFATSSKRIFHSADRGITWNNFWAPRNIIPSALTAQNGHLAIAFTTYNTDGANHDCDILRTNTGATGGGWTNITPGTGEFATESITYLPGTNDLVGAFRATNSDGFVQMISYDEGVNWLEFAVPGRVFKLDFTSSTKGWGIEYNIDNQPTNAYKFDGVVASNSLSIASAEVETSDADAPKIHAWPNPATDQITVELQGFVAEKAFLTVTDAMGRSVREFQITDEQTKMNVPVSDLPAGMYTIKVASAHQALIQRFIKN